MCTMQYRALGDRERSSYQDNRAPTAVNRVTEVGNGDPATKSCDYTRSMGPLQTKSARPVVKRDDKLLW